jgi:hypothetical protein
MKYAAKSKKTQELREIANFVEQHGEKMPEYVGITTTVYISLTETNYVKIEGSDPPEWETVIDEAGTKRNIKRFLDMVGNCEKEYADDRIRITKLNSFGDPMIVGTVDRAIACKRVVTGTKVVPEKMVEEYEYVCDEGLSLKKLVAN